MPLGFPTFPVGRTPTRSPSPPSTPPGTFSSMPLDYGSNQYGSGYSYAGIPLVNGFPAGAHPAGTRTPQYANRMDFEYNTPGGQYYHASPGAPSIYEQITAPSVLGRLGAQNYATGLQAQLGGYDQSIAGLNNNYALQAGLLGGQNDLSLRGLNESALYNQAQRDQQRFRDVDVQRQYNNTMSGLAQQGNQLALDDIAARQGLYDQGWANQQNYIGQRRGFADQGIGEERNYIGALQGFNTRGRDIGMGQNQLAYDRSYRTTASDATARGAYGSAGVDDNMSELRRQLGLSNQGTQLSYDETGRGLQNRSFNSELGYQREQAGLTNEYNTGKTSYDLTTQGLTTAAAQGRLNQQQQAAVDQRNNQLIDSIAAEYGIRNDEAAAALQRGTEQLGIDYNQAVISLTQGTQEKIDAQRQAQNQLLLSSLVSAGQGAGTAAPPIRTLPTVVNPAYGGVTRPIQGRY